MKTKQILKLLAFYCLFALGSSPFTLLSQTVWVNNNHEVYNYLLRLSQKGLLIFQDNIRPLSRIYLSSCLDSLTIKKGLLTKIEQKELDFYKKDFSEFNQTITENSSFLKNDLSGRWRGFFTKADDFLLRIDPIITGATFQGTIQNYTKKGMGFNAYGSVGKHWGFYSSFQDVTESGTGIDTLRENSYLQGVDGRLSDNKKSINYSELRIGISYQFKNGSLSIGQDELVSGYGENGRLILSNKSPTYPYLRLDFSPIKWLKFNYTHAWLNSKIIDSISTYPTGSNIFGSQRIMYRPKYMASHSIQFTLTKGLHLVLGESMVYSDQLQIGYLIPIMFFKIYDNLINNENINAGSNGQFFFQLNSRNQLAKTFLYSSLFIDEIRVSQIFDKTKSRNQIGFNIGGSITDLFLPYLSLYTEYTRINPFVYRNLQPTQNYTNSNYLLGDWMGSNADRWSFGIKYTPIPRLKIGIRYQSLRKGSEGTLDQQYFQQPQPSFLFDLQRMQEELHGHINYELINGLLLYSSLTLSKTITYPLNKDQKNTLFTIGLNFGL